MDALGTAEDSHHQSGEIAHEHPVAQGRVLQVVHLHAHAHKDIHEHLARVQDHQSEEEQDASLDAAALEGLEQEVG